jgi:hypothetical protein
VFARLGANENARGGIGDLSPSWGVSKAALCYLFRTAIYWLASDLVAQN